MKRLIVILFLATMISSCASTGTVKTAQPLSGKLSTSAFKSVEIQTSTLIADSEKEQDQLETLIMMRLREADLFEKVSPQGNSLAGQNNLQLKATIAGLNRISPRTRVLLGGLAGRATISVEVELSEKTTGKVIGAFVAEGKSSWGTVFSGTTLEAIERAVEKIVEFVENNM